jgi:hypothetical protein
MIIGDFNSSRFESLKNISKDSKEFIKRVFCYKKFDDRLNF